jgi:hypothetical protein
MVLQDFETMEKSESDFLAVYEGHAFTEGGVKAKSSLKNT